MSLWDWYIGRRTVLNNQPASMHEDRPEKPFRIKTQFSSTVFSGEPEAWVTYLNTPRWDRYDPSHRVSIGWSSKHQHLSFRAENSKSGRLSDALNHGIGLMREMMGTLPDVEKTFEQLVFGNAANGHTDLNLNLSELLPGEATREIRVDDDLAPVETNIVLNASLVNNVLNELDSVSGKRKEQYLAVAWPVIRRVVAQLGLSSYPRDRFAERIDSTLRMSSISVNLLYEGVKKGRLVPNVIGEKFHTFLARRDKIPEKELLDRHPYVRLLNELRFMRKSRNAHLDRDTARVLVREYLDLCYLRISLAGVMPDIPESMLPMTCRWKKKHVRTSSPQIGRNGIFDGDDLHAWKKTRNCLHDAGYIPTRQLGIGEFGRVYEAFNLHNPHIPFSKAHDTRHDRWK
ncbi:MAG: hypothetical protein AAF492_14680, partial [Verrucomicrobiota bacterium]